MNRNSIIYLLIALTFLSCNFDKSNSDKSTLNYFNSKENFFNDSEAAEINRLDSLFNDYLYQYHSDIDSAYKEFLSIVISGFDYEGGNINICDDEIMFEFSKLALIKTLSDSTLNKIFYRSYFTSVSKTDSIVIHYYGIDTKGVWINFLEKYNETDYSITQYIESIMQQGSFPPKYVFEDYLAHLDFDNQIHRLYVLTHLISEDSQCRYD